MEDKRSLELVADDDLLRRLVEILGQSRRVEADMVALIGEVDARRLYAGEASPSMFAFCTETLHLSEAAAYLRIAAARASGQHPVLLTLLASGRLHLTAIAKLAPHLTPENREALLQRATHKSKRQVEELIAELVPRPDVPTLTRKLPERRNGVTRALQLGPDDVAPLAPVGLDAAAPLAPLGPDGAAPREPLGLDRPATAVELRPDGVAGLAPERQPDRAASEHRHPPAGHARPAVI